MDRTSFDDGETVCVGNWNRKGKVFSSKRVMGNAARRNAVFCCAMKIKTAT